MYFKNMLYAQSEEALSMKNKLYLEEATSVRNTSKSRSILMNCFKKAKSGLFLIEKNSLRVVKTPTM